MIFLSPCRLLLLKLELFPGLCRPDVIEFDNLKRSNAHYNLQNAFNVAEKDLGLTKLLDPEGKWVKLPQIYDLSRVTLSAKALLFKKRLMAVEGNTSSHVC